MTSLDFSVLRPFIGDLVDGIQTTAWISGLAVLLSFALAVPGVVARVSPLPAVRMAARVYVEVMRNIPVLVLLYICYFGLSSSGWRVPSFLAGLAALVANATAYVIEIYRGGFEGVSPGQREAAAALDMGTVTTWRYVILPQALRIAFPAMGNQVVGIVLGSSLVMVISVPDLTYQAFSIGADTYHYFEIFIVAAVAYVVVVQAINVIWRLLGRILLPTYGV